MRTAQRILLLAFLIIVNNVMGSALPPVSIFLTPVVIILATYLIHKSNLVLWTKILLVILAVIGNDILVKLFAGGTHDVQGAGWINAFFILALFITTVQTFIDLKFIQKFTLGKSTAFTLLIPILGGIYLSYFGFFGMTYNSPASESVLDAKKNGAFLGQLQFSDTRFSYGEDSVEIKGGWAEREIRIGQRPKKCVSGRKSYSGIFRPL